jgi:predicted HD superfamily hydrolase involved in NAD metabolism
MHDMLKTLIAGMNFTGELKRDIYQFLILNNCPKTAEHGLHVGAEARRIAIRYEICPKSAEIAGWLHDISAVFPNHERIEVARQLGIAILPEEEAFPMIIHQKISKVMAKEIFGITDQSILDAVGCHTTLRRDATPLDLVLFVADKIAWDQAGIPPYIEDLQNALKKSLIHGAFSYIHYLWERKETLRVVHPWLAEAYEDLTRKLNVGK